MFVELGVHDPITRTGVDKLDLLDFKGVIVCVKDAILLTEHIGAKSHDTIPLNVFIISWFLHGFHVILNFTIKV